MLNKKHIIIFLALLVACMSIAVATDVDDATISSDVTDAVEADSTTTVQTQAVSSVSEDNNYKTIEKENKTVKQEEYDPVVTSEAEYNDSFENNSLNCVQTRNNMLTKNSVKEVKNNGEPTVINITEENFASFFQLKNGKQYFFDSFDCVTGDTIFNLYYLPDDQIKLNIWTDADYQITFIGKNNLTLHNVPFYVTGSATTFKDINFIYEGEISLINSGIRFGWVDWSLDIPLIMDNITVNYDGVYIEDEYLGIYEVIGSSTTEQNAIIQNSVINANVPAVPGGYSPINGSGISLINNNINITEKYAVDDDSSLSAIIIPGTQSGYPILIENNNITVIGESDLVGITFGGNVTNSNITNNTILVYSPKSTATGVKIIGNDNKVTDNKILANDKTGNDAVTATGENNVVENNTAAEFDTRISTNIELNYDGTPIDVGQRLLIRGVFTAEGQDASAECIKIYDNEEELTSINVEDGTITYAYTPTVAGDHNITFKFEGNETHKETETTISITANEHIKEYTIQVDTTEFTAGTTATISASIYADDEKAIDISKGKVTFKVNGKTLKDTNGKVIYAKVTGGVATIENYEVPADWAKNGTTIQAVYSGSSDVAKMSSEKTEITVTPKELILTTSDVQATAGSKITLTATLNDDTINTGKIVFKINGKTVKDENGKVIYAKVVNGTVNVQYTLPADMETKEYNLTATYISSDYERLEDTKTLTIN